MNECFCDYDQPTFYHAAIRKARKEHQCKECWRTIKAGEKYEHVRGKWDGEVGTFDTCEHCLALKDWVKAHVPCFCFEHGNIRDGAIEAAQEFAHEAPGLLFGAYRREIAIRRQRGGNHEKL